MEEIEHAVKTFIQIFEQENMVTVINHKIENDVVEAGNNFYSSILSLKVEYDNGAQNLYKKALLKIPSMGINYKNTQNSNFYDKEIYMYETVLPRMYECWNGKTLTPKFYAATALKSLILENLNESGFKIKDKKTRLDLNHSEIALRSMAQFHALSLKYLQTYDIDEKKMGPLFSDLTEEESQKQIAELLHPLYDKFLSICSTLVSKRIFKILEDIKNGLNEKINFMMKRNEDGLNVIIHGDYWTSNILFRYDDEKNIVESKMIDFQMSCITSPVVDLIRFFITSVQFDLYEKHKEKFISIYLNSFNDMLSFLKIDNTYTKKNLNDSFKKYEEVYIACIAIALQFITSNESQLSDIVNTTSEEYIWYVQKWMNHLDEEKYFNS